MGEGRNQCTFLSYLNHLTFSPQKKREGEISDRLGAIREFAKVHGLLQGFRIQPRHGMIRARFPRLFRASRVNGKSDAPPSETR